MDKLRITNCLGKRALLTRTLGGGIDLNEAEVCELSPSREHVRLRFANGNCIWTHANDYRVVEILRGSMAANAGQKPPKGYADCAAWLEGLKEFAAREGVTIIVSTQAKREREGNSVQEDEAGNRFPDAARKR
jgi:hypothetical protein